MQCGVSVACVRFFSEAPGLPLFICIRRVIHDVHYDFIACGYWCEVNRVRCDVYTIFTYPSGENRCASLFRPND